MNQAHTDAQRPRSRTETHANSQSSVSVFTGCDDYKSRIKKKPPPACAIQRTFLRRFIIIVKMAVHIFNTYNRMFDSILALYSKIRFVFESVSEITTAPYVNATETHSERRWRLFKRRWRPVGHADADSHRVCSRKWRVTMTSAPAVY